MGIAESFIDPEPPAAPPVLPEPPVEPLELPEPP